MRHRKRSEPDGDGAIVFDRVRVFDGVDAHDDWRVVVAGNVILDAGPAAGDPPRGATVIETEGKTLLPGLIDIHVHIALVDPRAVLLSGVTTVRDLGWPIEEISALARDLAADLRAGPRVFFAGPMLTASGGYPSKADWAPAGTARTVLHEDDARPIVRDLAARGASVIKIAQDPAGPVMPIRLIEAIVREAHAAGLMVTSHVASVEQYELAVEVGVDGLTHGLWSDEPLPAVLARRTARSHIAVMPTISVRPSAQRVETLALLVASGCRILYGTDMGHPGSVAGVNIDEMRMMIGAGMDAIAVLRSATSEAAAQLRLPARGRIVKDAFADLLLVDGDPVTDLHALARASMVMREGVVVSE